MSRPTSGFIYSPVGITPWQVLFLAFVLGILALRGPVAAGSGLVLLWYLTRAQARDRMPAYLVAAFFLGLAWAASLMPAPPGEVPQWMARREKARITGRAVQVRDRPGSRVRILLEDARYEIGDEAGQLPGRLAWTWDMPDRRVSPGDLIAAPLRVKPVRGWQNPGTWDFEFYRHRQGVFYRAYSRGRVDGLTVQPGSFGPDLRTRVRDTIIAHTPPGQGQGLVLALLTGDRSHLHPDTVDLFRRASLAHVLALSGMHLGFVAALGWLLASLAGRINPRIYLRVPRPKLAVILAAPPVAAYLWLGWGAPSLARAGLMFAFWGLLLLLNRGRVLLDGLFFALAVIVLADPLMVFDAGLQLSAAAVAGIAVMWPSVSLWIRKDHARLHQRILYKVAAILALSLVANLAVLPLLVNHFGQLSPHLYLNVLWLPLVGFFILPLGFTGLLLSVVPGLSPAGGALLHLAALAADVGINFTARLDGAIGLNGFVLLRPGWIQAAGYWIVLGGVFAGLSRSRKPVWSPVLIGLALLIGAEFADLPGLFRGEVGLTMLDVGQGQALVVQTPSGGRVLVDGGGTMSENFDIGRSVVAPALTWKRPPVLDAVVLTHRNADHMRGLLYPLAEFGCARFAHNGRWPEGKDGRDLGLAVKRGRVPVEVWSAGRVFDLGRGAALEVLHPGPGFASYEDNNYSLVLRLTWNGRGLALLTGDLESPGIRALLDSGRDLDANVLVVPHHGSKGSLYPELYDRVSPSLALVSAGYLNPWDFPRPEVVAELEKRGCPVLATCECGAVKVAWDGPDARPRVVTARDGGLGPVSSRN